MFIKLEKYLGLFPSGFPFRSSLDLRNENYAMKILLKMAITGNGTTETLHTVDVFSLYRLCVLKPNY